MALALAVLPAGLIASAVAQECVPEFTIFTEGSIEAKAGTSVSIDFAIKNTGSCAGETLVIAKVPEGWDSSSFYTSRLSPDSSETTAEKPFRITIPADAQTSTITLLAESAEPVNVEVIISGSPSPPVQEESTQPAEENAPINTTPLLPVNTPEIKPQETQPAEQNVPQESTGQLIMNTEPQPQAEQPSGSITGLITGNPVIQSAVAMLLLFGAALAYQLTRSEGYRYRFKNKS